MRLESGKSVGSEHRRGCGEGSLVTAAKSGPELGVPTERRVGWGFIALYALAFTSTSVLFLPPLLVTLPLKINSLVGIKEAPNSLALVAGAGASVSMIANPCFVWMSERTSLTLCTRTPW